MDNKQMFRCLGIYKIEHMFYTNIKIQTRGLIMNDNKEIKDIIDGARKIKGFEDKEDDDCLQAYEDVEWILLRLGVDDWED